MLPAAQEMAAEPGVLRVKKGKGGAGQNVFSYLYYLTPGRVGDADSVPLQVSAPGKPEKRAFVYDRVNNVFCIALAVLHPSDRVMSCLE